MKVQQTMSRTFLIGHLVDEMRDSDELRFEIQLVDEYGQMVGAIVVGDDDSDVRIRNVDVPEAVLQSVRRLEVGETEYVDVLGNPTYPGSESTAASVDGVFFVRHLTPGDDWPGQRTGQVFQVQLVNANGQATASGYVSSNEHELTIEGAEIPRPVIEAVHRLSVGNGEYVDRNGHSVVPGQW